MNISQSTPLSREKPSRLNPFPSKILSRNLLSKSGSTKKTFHLTLDLKDSDIHYQPGDAIGVYPENSPQEIQLLLSALQATGEEIILHPKKNQPFTLKEFLLKEVNLEKLPQRFFDYFEVEKTEEASPCSIIEKSHKRSIDYQHFASLFLPLLPRLYSIASSSLVTPDSVDLLVAHFSYNTSMEEKKGLCSTFLCETAEIDLTPIWIYLQPNPNFSLPDDDKDIIMIGPGTGVAPYRAFMQERIARNASGKNWLFFGERNRLYDFYYQSYWEELKENNQLNFCTAFSRDLASKYYVQDELQKHKKELFLLIENGAYIYLCGDATHMAKDVIQTLLSVFETEGNMDSGQAQAYLRQLRKQRRFMQDVY